MEFGTAFIKGGFRPVIIKDGRKWSQIVLVDGASIIVAKKRVGKIRVKPLNGYTLDKLAKRLLRPRNVLGIKMSISKAARAILSEAATTATTATGDNK